MSPIYCRPIYLLRAEETEPRLLDLFVNTTDEARDILTNTTNSISLTNGKTYTVVHKVHDSMKDLKIKTELSGLAGADCIICDSRKADWKDAKKI